MSASLPRSPMGSGREYLPVAGVYQRWNAHPPRSRRTPRRIPSAFCDLQRFGPDARRRREL